MIIQCTVTHHPQSLRQAHALVADYCKRYGYPRTRWSAFVMIWRLSFALVALEGVV